MLGLRSLHLRDSLHPLSSNQHFLLGNDRDHHDLRCGIWDADGKEENGECLGMCVRFLLHLECPVNPDFVEITDYEEIKANERKNC